MFLSLLKEQRFSFFQKQFRLRNKLDYKCLYLLKRKIIIMSDDQGFANDINSEMVSINFIPLFPPKKYKPKLYVNQLKLQPEKLTFQQSIFINRQLQGQLADKFINAHKEKIIFSQNESKKEKKQGLSFQSGFQSSNLEFAVQEGNQYHLYIRPDTNTKAHHQWFYFVLKNKAVKSVTLIIHNFNKANMLYTRGLKPFYKSLKEGCPYYQQISNAVIYQQDQNEEQEGVKYCLKFDFQFKHAFDQIQFCCQPPYTLHRLNALLVSLPFKKFQISRSVLGEKIHALLINEQKKTKATVVIMARQHPGEAVGSWMMEGFINRLQQLDNNIFWVIIPMVNVDGVKIGNNRTGILGYDFNRNWNVDEESLRYHLFPELVGIIKYFKKRKKESSNRVKMFIDLHGHSSQPNAFAYGPPLFQQSQYYQNSRLFPFMLSQANSNFNLRQCSYQIDITKKNCARSMFFHRLGFPYSYTIESSFGIYNQKNINQLEMMKMGEDICSTTVSFLNLLILKKNNEKLKEMINDVRKSGLDQYEIHQNENSDSDYDENEPKRVQFQKKVASLLKDPTLQQKEINRLQEENQKSQRANKLRLRLNHLSMISPRRQKTKMPRIRTEGVKQESVNSVRQSSNGRRSSLFLPSINGLQMLEGPQKKPRKLKRVHKNYSLRQITDHLLTFKHNKIGRRILILNDYPTSSV